MQSVYFEFLKHFYGELMYTKHNSVCLINIDLIIYFFFLISYKNKIYLLDGLHLIVHAFILIYLPKYILHSVNLYDLGNVAYNIV